MNPKKKAYHVGALNRASTLPAKLSDLTRKSSLGIEEY